MYQLCMIKYNIQQYIHCTLTFLKAWMYYLLMPQGFQLFHQLLFQYLYSCLTIFSKI